MSWPRFDARFQSYRGTGRTVTNTERGFRSLPVGDPRRYHGGTGPRDVNSSPVRPANSITHIVMMQPYKNRQRDQTAYLLDGTRRWRISSQRQVFADFVVVCRVRIKNAARVKLASAEKHMKLPGESGSHFLRRLDSIFQ